MFLDLPGQFLQNADDLSSSIGNSTLFLVFVRRIGFKSLLWVHQSSPSACACRMHACRGMKMHEVVVKMEASVVLAEVGFGFRDVSGLGHSRSGSRESAEDLVLFIRPYTPGHVEETVSSQTAPSSRRDRACACDPTCVTHHGNASYACSC